MEMVGTEMGLNTVLPSNRSGVNGREFAVANPSTRGHDDTSLLVRLEGLMKRDYPLGWDFPTVSHSPRVIRQNTRSEERRVGKECV